MEIAIELISKVGFPIGVCLILMWYIKTMIDNHRAETKEFTAAINKNTLVLQSLCDKLEEVFDER